MSHGCAGHFHNSRSIVSRVPSEVVMPRSIPDVDSSWQEEVVRRPHEVHSGKVRTISWEEVQQKGRILLRFTPQPRP
jgi:Putative addiction module component